MDQGLVDFDGYADIATSANIFQCRNSGNDISSQVRHTLEGIIYCFLHSSHKC